MRTLFEGGNSGIALTEIDGQRAYNNKASRCQRIMVLNTADLNRPYVIDIFRVTGGTTHDYVWHGAIRFDSTAESSSPLVANTQTYPMLEGSETWVDPGANGPYYGFWRNLSSNQASGDFQITYRDTSAANRDVRLWMTDPGNPNVYVRRTPVPERDNSEPADWFVNGLWRPSTIIRLRVTSGPLQSVFVSVIEPMKNGVSSIQSIERLPISGSSLEATALRITFTDGLVDTCMVKLRNPQVAWRERRFCHCDHHERPILVDGTHRGSLHRPHRVAGLGRESQPVPVPRRPVCAATA
jgi:hypothetical protein